MTARLDCRTHELQILTRDYNLLKVQADTAYAKGQAGLLQSQQRELVHTKVQTNIFKILHYIFIYV